MPDLVRALQHENEQLRASFARDVVLEQAKGALSARFGLLPEEALELMRGLARSQRRELQEFAAEIVRNEGRLEGVSGASGRPLSGERRRAPVHGRMAPGPR